MSQSPLGVSSSLSLSPEQREMLAALELADLWFVAERLERKGLLAADEIPESIREFKRYLALVGLGHRGLAMASPKIDEVWHAFILFTREYADFCQAVFGEFIHHVPRTSRTPASAQGPDGFLDAYRRVFGEPPRLWVRAAGRPGGADCGEGECTGEGRQPTIGGLADCGEDCTGEGDRLAEPALLATDCGTEDCTGEG